MTPWTAVHQAPKATQFYYKKWEVFVKNTQSFHKIILLLCSEWLISGQIWNQGKNKASVVVPRKEDGGSELK